MNFLPKNYEAPRGASSYMELQDGENRFRILSQPVLGWEDWDANRRPVRYRFDDKPAKSIDPGKPAKHFWSMIVWNYACEQIQILTVKQSTIQKQIQNLCLDADWGAPYFYDIKILKSGEGKETRYQVNPVPHKPVTASIQKAFNDRWIELEALYDNADPFANTGNRTPGIFTREETPVVDDDFAISDKAFTSALYEKLMTCSPEYQETIRSACDKYGFKFDLSNLPKGEIADKLAAAIERNASKQLKAVGE